MAYFKDKEELMTGNTEDLLRQLSDICLEELMLSSDAYVCMIKLNMHGYKRLHRYLSKEFQDLYLAFQYESLKNFDRVLSSEIRFETYKTKDIKEHLQNWTEVLKKHIKTVGAIIKEIFENEGYISCTAQKLQKILYKNIIKNERALKKI